MLGQVNLLSIGYHFELKILVRQTRSYLIFAKGGIAKRELATLIRFCVTYFQVCFRAQVTLKIRCRYLIEKILTQIRSKKRFIN